MNRRVLIALRPVSPVDRMFAVGAALARRLDAGLEVLADPAHPNWSEIEGRLARLSEGDVNCRLTAKPGLDVRQVVEHARSHECIVSVVVGRPAAWSNAGAADQWEKLECPLVAASDHPDLPIEP